MPVHPAIASKFPLLEGISSFQQFMEDPALAGRRKAFDDHPGYDAPAVAARMEEAPGPHGPVPVRIYALDQPGDAPGLVWTHGGGFIGGDLDMPEADWFARELVARAGIVVVSVDYRLCVGGVAYPVPHDDVVAAPSTTTCGRPESRSRPRWPWPASTCGRFRSRRCCTASSTCPPPSSRSARPSTSSPGSSAGTSTIKP